MILKSDQKNPLMKINTMRFANDEVAVVVMFEVPDGIDVNVKNVDIESLYSESEVKLSHMRKEFHGIKRILYYWADFMSEIRLMFTKV